MADDREAPNHPAPAGGADVEASSLRLALQMARIGTYRRDIPARRLHYSPFVAEILGLPAAPYDESLDEALQRIHPDDRAALAAIISRSDPAGTSNIEYRIIRPDGEVRWVSIASEIVVTSEGQPTTALAVMADVTDRRAAEQLRTENEERLRLAIQLANLATWRHDLKRDTIHYSAVAAGVLGMPQQEFWEPAARAVARVHPDDRETVISARRRSRGRRGAYDLPAGFRIVRPDGEVRWLSVRSQTIRNPDRSPAASVYVARDVTDERTTAAAVEESRERLELALEGADLGTWNANLLLGRTDFDARSAVLLDLPMRDHVFQHEWADLVHPDDYAVGGRQWIAHMKGENPTYEAEYRLKDLGGRTRWVRSRGRVLARDAQGRAVRAAGTYMDVTEQKESAHALAEAQAYMSALFENARDPIILVDTALRILRFNDQTHSARWLMHGPDLEQGGMVLDAVHPEDRGPLRDEIDAVVATRRPRGFELQVHALAGAPVPHDFEFVPVVLPDGNLRGVGIISRDISARKQNEAIIAETQRLESLGRLVGGVAHDFNNLLGVILGFSELAAGTLDERSPAREDIQQVIAAAESAASVTRQLLAFARRHHVEPQDVDLNVVIEKLQKLLQRVLGESITLQTSLWAAPLVAHIDAGQFEQVVVNLAANARDAMPDGGRLIITTRVETADPSGNSAAPDERPRVVVEVRDTGTGMTPDTMARMFEPFFTTKEAGRGTGLGLATCHGIITQAGGLLTAISAPGYGTTFRIALPLLETSRVTPGRTDLPQPTAARPGRARVLLVEDQDELRAVAERSLTAAGYRVFAAANPIQALEIASSRDDIAVVLTDLVMPVMDGVQLVDLIITLLGPKPVIFMSGYADSGLIAAASGRAGGHFLPKPFTPAQLTALVASVIGTQSLAGQRKAAAG